MEPFPSKFSIYMLFLPPTAKICSWNSRICCRCVSRARSVIDIEIEALEDLKANLDENFYQAIRLIEACPGRVIITGMGKSGHVGKKIAATLSSPVASPPRP